uniref:Uncharacterized protein n=1 Tax=Suricata suricatta TaxID=37032 RepID=A0A673TTH3_SURSU
MSILETSQYLCSQLEKTKQSFRGLTEKFLTSRATAYTLANQLQKYRKPCSEEHKALTDSVLEEEAPLGGEPAEKTRLGSAAGWGTEGPAWGRAIYYIKWAAPAARMKSTRAKTEAGKSMTGTELDKDNRQGCGNRVVEQVGLGVVSEIA